MTEQYLSTSRLGNVIQLITLGNGTGILKVMRGQGSTREQGEIHFANGTPTFAMLGQLVGQAALTMLQNWSESSYLFLEGMLPQREQSAHEGVPIGRQSEPAPPAQGGFGPRLIPRSPQPPEDPLLSAPSGTAPLSISASGPTPRPSGNGLTGNLAHSGAGALQSGPMPMPPMRHELFQGHVVPRRTASLNRLDTLSLDRRERMVLLLIDGQRSVDDLIRLTRRSKQEVQMFLSHLFSLRLIE